MGSLNQKEILLHHRNVQGYSVCVTFIKQREMFNLLEPCSLNQSYIFTVCQVENLRVSNEEVHILLSKIIEISKFVRERKVFSNW